MSVQPVDRRPRRWNEQRRNTNRCYTFGSSARVRSGAQTRVREQVFVDHQRGAVLRRVELNQSARLSGRRGFVE